MLSQKRNPTKTQRTQRIFIHWLLLLCDLSDFEGNTKISILRQPLHFFSQAISAQKPRYHQAEKMLLFTLPQFLYFCTL